MTGLLELSSLWLLFGDMEGVESVSTLSLGFSFLSMDLLNVLGDFDKRLGEEIFLLLMALRFVLLDVP